jgi:hypothetical protein
VTGFFEQGNESSHNIRTRNFLLSASKRGFPPDRYLKCNSVIQSVVSWVVMHIHCTRITSMEHDSSIFWAAVRRMTMQMSYVRIHTLQGAHQSQRRVERKQNIV